jgi:hypothetical protein
MSDEWIVICAEEGEEFQEYEDKDGKRIAVGEPVGIENPETRRFILLNGVFYAN